MHGRRAFAHLLQGCPGISLKSHRTFKPLQESHARLRFASEALLSDLCQVREPYLVRRAGNGQKPKSLGEGTLERMDDLRRAMSAVAVVGAWRFRAIAGGRVSIFEGGIVR